MNYLTEIENHRAEISIICQQLGVRRLELFGSALDSDSPRDLDFLLDLGVRPPADYATAYFSLQEKLQELFALPVDLVTLPGLKNPYLRQRVEQTKTLLYAA